MIRGKGESSHFYACAGRQCRGLRGRDLGKKSVESNIDLGGMGKKLRLCAVTQSEEGGGETRLGISVKKGFCAEGRVRMEEVYQRERKKLARRQGGVGEKHKKFKEKIEP